MLELFNEFESSMGLEPIYSTTDPDGNPATVGEEAARILRSNFNKIGISIQSKANIGYLNTTDVDFTISDNTFTHSETGSIIPGNNIIRSVTKPVGISDIIRYQAEIVTSTSKAAMFTFKDNANNIIYRSIPFISDAFVKGDIGVPSGATKVEIAFRVGKFISVQIASGEMVDDTVRDVSLKNTISAISNSTIGKDYQTRTDIPFTGQTNDYIDYTDGVVKGTGGVLEHILLDVPSDKRIISYDTEIITATTSKVAALTYLDEYNNVMGYTEPFDSNARKKGRAVIPNNVKKVALTRRIGKHFFSEFIGGSLTDNTVKNRLSVTKNVSFDTPDNTYATYDTGVVTAGNNIFNSVTVDLSDNDKFVYYKSNIISTVNKVAAAIFLDSNGNIVYYEQVFNANVTAEFEIQKPLGSVKVILTFRVGNAVEARILGNSYTNDYARTFQLDALANQTKSYQIARTLYDNPRIGESRLGNFRIETKQKNPQVIKRAYPPTGALYTDVNACKKQYNLINGSHKTLQDGMLNKMQSEVIDFTPANDGFVRIPIGKDSQDRFYFAYVVSDRKGSWLEANKSNAKLEVSTDFVNFTTIWSGATADDVSGLTIANYTNILPYQVKELGNGNLLVQSAYTRSDLPANDGIADRANQFSGYFILSKEHNSISLCSYTDLQGTVKPMNTTHHVISENTYYTNQPTYDWSIFIYNNIVVCTEYGDRVDSGAVWYSEDNGTSFKQIFWMPDHYTEGGATGVTQVHIHGVMYDFYTNRIYIIAGEDNRNLFWSDKGINTTNTDWNVESIRSQTRYSQLSYMQLVNGYPFRDCIVYGSDFNNMGAFMRVNRLIEGMPQQIEVAHEILPQIYGGTLYCAGGTTQRDQDSPVLMCMTRENAMPNETQQTEHLRQHLGRVVATYDGFNFFEIWRDDTFGYYDMYNPSTAQVESRQIAKCTRDMNAWLCNNGDLVIKYSGRDFIYMKSDYSEILYGDFCSQVVRYKNVGKCL